MSDEFQPEFCQEVVAVLVAAIVASIIDPIDEDHPDADDAPLPLAQQFAEAPPDAQRVAASLASLMRHLEVRVQALQQHGMPDHLAVQYQEVFELLTRTAVYQMSVGTPQGQTLQ